MDASLFRDKLAPPPIAVGGVGGSGTRLVAQLLLDCGVFLGDALNHGHDNLVFTVLLKRPDLVRGGNQREIAHRLATFAKFMAGGPLTSAERQTLDRSWREFFQGGHIEAKKRADAAYALRLAGERPKRWGWKEPNTHLLLPQLAKTFDAIKLVHVVRSGLDMAFSRNTQQLHNWGSLFQVEVPQEPERIPSAQLEFWLRSNRHAIDSGQALLGSNFYVLSFDRLCRQPRTETAALLTFAEIDYDDRKLDALAGQPKPERLLRKWRNEDLALFDPQQIVELQQHHWSLPDGLPL